MFLTRFEINKARRDAKKLLGSPQAMHAAVLSGFPPSEEDSGNQRVLWRVDSAAARNLLYIVSPSEPDLTHLVEQVGWPNTTSWLTKDYQPMLDSLTASQRWGFRLTANVTVSKKLSPDGRSQRYGHVTADQQREWFTSRTGKFGFTLASNSNDIEALEVRDRAVKQFNRQGRQVTLTVATFVGVLEVTDGDALRVALAGGIGPAKAYGCGLLTLAPV